MAPPCVSAQGLSGTRVGTRVYTHSLQGWGMGSLGQVEWVSGCPPAPALPRHCPPAAPRSCVIDKDELKDGLRVLIPMDDKLLYAGHVQTVHSPDM